MTDQTRITNLCSAAAEELSRILSRDIRIPMLVTVTVTHAGETIAEGWADTSDHLTLTVVPSERDPDA